MPPTKRVVKKSMPSKSVAPAPRAKTSTRNATPKTPVAVQVAPITPDEARTQLRALAMNLWWSWNEIAQRPFAALDPVLWHATKHSPLSVLAYSSPPRAKNQDFAPRSSTRALR